MPDKDKIMKLLKGKLIKSVTQLEKTKTFTTMYTKSIYNLKKSITKNIEVASKCLLHNSVLLLKVFLTILIVLLMLFFYVSDGN